MKATTLQARKIIREVAQERNVQLGKTFTDRGWANKKIAANERYIAFEVGWGVDKEALCYAINVRFTQLGYSTFVTCATYWLRARCAFNG